MYLNILADVSQVVMSTEKFNPDVSREKNLYQPIVPHIDKIRGFVDKGAETPGGMWEGSGGEMYAHSLGFKSIDELGKWLEEKKRVIDLGSGYGGLAFSAAKQGVSSEIISINPRLARNTRIYEITQQNRIVEELGYPINGKTKEGEYILNEADRKEYKALKGTHDKTAVAASWSDLSIFPDRFVGGIICSNSFLYYTSRFNLDSYDRSLREISRVLAHGGEVRITPLIDPASNRNIGDALYVPKKATGEITGFELRDAFKKKLSGFGLDSELLPIYNQGESPERKNNFCLKLVKF